LNIVANGNITREGYEDIDAENTMPPAPTGNYTRVFGSQVAGRNLLTVMGAAGINYVVGPSSIDRRTALIIPQERVPHSTTSVILQQ